VFVLTFIGLLLSPELLLPEITVQLWFRTAWETALEEGTDCNYGSCGELNTGQICYENKRHNALTSTRRVAYLMCFEYFACIGGASLERKTCRTYSDPVELILFGFRKPRRDPTAGCSFHAYPLPIRLCCGTRVLWFYAASNRVFRNLVRADKTG